MADSKVSELTVATSPLGGGESLYVVQQSGSRKVTVDNFVGSMKNPNLTGNIKISGNETITTATDIKTSFPVTLIEIPAGDGICPLVDVAANGQIKVIMATGNGGGTFTLLKSNIAGNANVQFFRLGQSATLMYQGDKWFPLGGTANIIFPTM